MKYYQKYDPTKGLWAKYLWVDDTVVEHKRKPGKYKMLSIKAATTKRRIRK